MRKIIASIIVFTPFVALLVYALLRNPLAVIVSLGVSAIVTLWVAALGILLENTANFRL